VIFAKAKKQKLAQKRMKFEGSTADQMETLLLICVLTFCFGIIYPAFYDPAYMTPGGGSRTPKEGGHIREGGGNGGLGGWGQSNIK